MISEPIEHGTKAIINAYVSNKRTLIYIKQNQAELKREDTNPQSLLRILPFISGKLK